LEYKGAKPYSTGKSSEVQVRVKSTGKSGKKGILCVLGLRKGKKAEQAGKVESSGRSHRRRHGKSKKCLLC